MKLSNHRKFVKWCNKNALNASEILVDAERYMLEEKDYGNPRFLINISFDNKFGGRSFFRFVVKKPMVNVTPQVIRLPLYRFEVCK